MKPFFFASIIAIMALVFSPHVVAEEPNAPPIAQPLVREGEFARQLVEALRMTPAQSEAEAESMLTAVGIAPQKGWIADYPVTPALESIGIEKGVASAADTGNLGMGRRRSLEGHGRSKSQNGAECGHGGRLTSQRSGSTRQLSGRYAHL